MPEHSRSKASRQSAAYEHSVSRPIVLDLPPVIRMNAAAVSRRSFDPVQRFVRSEFARHGMLVFAASMLVNVFNYVFHFVLIRHLGVAAYGNLASLIAAVTIASVPAGIIALIVVRYSAEFEALQDTPRIAAMASGAIKYGGLFALVVSAFSYAFAPAVAAYLKIDDVETLRISVVVLLFNLYLPIVRGVFQGMQRFTEFAISTTLEGIGKVVFGVGLSFMGFGLRGAMGGYAIGSAVSLVYTLARVYGSIGPCSQDFKLDGRRLLRTSCGIAITMLTITGLGFGDVLMVKHYFSQEVAGIYGAVSLVGKMLFFVVAFGATVLLPKATAAAARGISPRKVLAQSAIAIGSFSAIGLALFEVAPRYIVQVIAGSAYGEAAPYLFPYGIAMVLLAATNLAATYKIGIHCFDYVLPLLVIAVAEVGSVMMFHGSILQVIVCLAIGNAAALIATTYRIGILTWKAAV